MTKNAIILLLRRNQNSTIAIGMTELTFKKKSTDKGHRNHIVHPVCLIASTLKISYIINKHISQTD